MTDPHPRHIKFDFVQNLRDLGGYRTRDGRRVAWRRLYRSGELRHQTTGELTRLREETGLASVLDLRGDTEIKRDRVGLLAEAGIRYHNVPLLTEPDDPEKDDELFARFSNIGQFYVMMAADEAFGERVVAALELIAAPENHPLLFHCTIGKDRTGILSAIVLSLLGVSDDDIINDYTLTAPSMAAFVARMRSNPATVGIVDDLPAYFWEAAADSMALFLATLRREFGSVRGYIEAQGTTDSLVSRLEDALLD